MKLASVKIFIMEINLTEHPVDLFSAWFEEAKKYEKTAIDNDSPFTWSEHESLLDLEKPERVAQIKEDYEKRLEKLKKTKKITTVKKLIREII